MGRKHKHDSRIKHPGDASLKMKRPKRHHHKKKHKKNKKEHKAETSFNKMLKHPTKSSIKKAIHDLNFGNGSKKGKRKHRERDRKSKRKHKERKRKRHRRDGSGDHLSRGAREKKHEMKKLDRELEKDALDK